ncbi:hypothetical protein HNR65_003248 [Desulfosalsimonas propionicica]|uniref:Ice-binding protein C-terminal domain-containing protein n=1 Tax=Desulfosalsimonas propionicica TaxID=332175 RepID=A0A7W0CBZ9_9BACT|nr:PEP-CTERM sorting domain-containing protein [Desulfosalsimonas propionicica]MBA2882893.1 hypothetical protein [Desulfosalsimonas propionicica]
MKRAGHSLKIIVSVVLMLLGAYGFASAVPIYGEDGIESLGAFEGDFSFMAASNTSATIDVSLTNTSPADNGGYLTAFAFFVPVASFSVEDSILGNFDLLAGPVQASPYADFDLGASANTTWLGQGSPNDGIGVGDTGVFQFTLSGTGFLGLTEDSFFNAGDPWFAARFMGFEDDGSDKVPARVPEPAIMLLVGVGLAGIAAYGRKRKKF